MLFERVRTTLAERVGSWAIGRGLAPPESVPLAPAPPHVEADLALSYPLAAAKAARMNPMAVAAELKALLGPPYFSEATAAKPGFVNLRLSDAALAENLGALLADPVRYGTPDKPIPRSVLFEFVSANPTGPLHLASGRAAALGDSLVRILRRLGRRVAAEYYVNDAGRQVELLGLSVEARWRELHGEKAAVPEGGYLGDYVRELASQAPAEAASWDAAAFGRFAIDRLLSEHRRDMTDYRVSFDRWYRESELHARGEVEKTLAFLNARGMVYEKDGARWLGTAGEGGDDKDRVLVRSDGRPTYFLADVAYHKDKCDRGWDVLVDIWGADHHGYVPRMRAAMAALGRPPEAFRPIVHQLVHLYRGEELVKMSKRAGEFVTLRDLVEAVGADACRYFFAMHAPTTHMNFDYELAKKRSQENPVFYVQYVHARIASIFREAEERGLSAESSESRMQSSELLKMPEERALLVKLFWFPRALEACAEEMAPHPLTTYLTELAGAYHVFYERCRVLDPADRGKTSARLSLCKGVQAGIREGLGLLGVSAPEKM